MPSCSPATWCTHTPIRTPGLRGSRSQSSSRVWERDRGRMASMADPSMLQRFLADAKVDTAVFELRPPDYRAMLLAVDGLVPGPSDQVSDALLQTAETAARQALSNQPVEQFPHVAAWRETYRAFGAKPQ